MLILRKFIILFALFGFILTSNQAYAKNELEKFWDVLSGKNKQEIGPDPSETLEAPFGEDKVYTENHKFAHFKDDDFSSELLDIKNQHRNNRDIANWAAQTSATLMTFTIHDSKAVYQVNNFDKIEKYKPQKELLTEYMTTAGKTEFNAFLETTRIIDIMKSNNVKLVSIIDDTPKLIKGGTFDGIYRWLFEVPIKISYVPLELTNYEKNVPKTQAVMIEVQVTRIGAKVGEHNVKIEGWEVKGRKKNKKNKF